MLEVGGRREEGRGRGYGTFGVGEEVVGEFRLRAGRFAEHAHAEDILVEGEGFLGVFDAEHGVVLRDCEQYFLGVRDQRNSSRMYKC